MTKRRPGKQRPFRPEALEAYAVPALRPRLGPGGIQWRYTITVPPRRNSAQDAAEGDGRRCGEVGADASHALWRALAASRCDRVRSPRSGQAPSGPGDELQH